MGIKRYKGKLIVFEGIDGAGKTTTIHLIASYLNKLGYRTFITGEPTFMNKQGRLFRKYVLSGKINDVYLSLMLLIKDREIHIKKQILPYLYDGYVVLLDRYLLSTIAYQSVNKNIKDVFSFVSKKHNFILKPDITFFLDVSPPIAIKRIKRKNKDSFENIVFLQMVYENYKVLVGVDFFRNFFQIKMLCAEKKVNKIVYEIVGEILSLIGGNKLCLL